VKREPGPGAVGDGRLDVDPAGLGHLSDDGEADAEAVVVASAVDQ